MAGRYPSEEESRAESVAKMGEELGNIHYELYHQIVLLHIRWQEYRRLFADSSGTIDLLNATAPSFFYDLERIMWEDVILHLRRVAESPRMGKHEHLTIQRLPSLVSDLAVQKSIQEFVDSAMAKTEFARDWRNRKLAHTELPPLPGQIAKPLAPASRQHVEEALAALRAVMSCLESNYLECTIGYEHAIEPLGGAASLLRVLRDGREAQIQHFRSQGVEMP
jgi:hypothetical protein